MNTEAMAYKQGDVLDYTPSSALTAGQLLQVAGVAAMAVADIAANAQGAVQVRSNLKVRAAAVAGNKGDVLYWDEDGDPVGGTAGTGAATTIASDGDFALGSLAEALAATDGEAIVRLNEFAPGSPAWTNRVHETKSADYTVDAEDNGKVIHVDTDAKTITLPATIAGLDVIFVNDGADGTVALTLSPNASDKIMGPDIAGTDNKDQVNTKATAVRGDFIHLVGDGVNGWFIVEKRGTWAEES